MICLFRVHLVILLFSFSRLIVQAQGEEISPPERILSDSAILLHAVTVEAYQISGGLRTIPGSLSVLTRENLGISDGTNLATTLNTLPGVSMQSGTYATSRIVIRGMGSRTPFNTNRIRTYLNDIPLTGFDGVSTPEEIEMQGIGRMEIIKGPASALYGSGLGGSINLYTPVQDDSALHAGLQYGSFQTVKAFLSATSHPGNTTLRGNISHLQSEGYRENNDYRRTSLFSNGQWKKSRVSLNWLLLFIDVKAGIPSSIGKTLFESNPSAAAANWKATGGFEKYRKGVAGLTLVNNLSENLINRITLFGKWNDSYEKRPFNNLDDQSMSAGIREKLSFHAGKSDWVFGTEWITEQYEWKLDLEDSLFNRNRENLNQLNLFGMVDYHPGPRLHISVAGAVNLIGYTLKDLYAANGIMEGKRKFPLIISPRIGINYAPTDYLAVYTSVGHGYSLPSPEETLLPEGEVNPGIKPEQGIQYEIGSRLSLFGRTSELEGTIYWIELNDLLVTKRVTEDVFTGINAGKTRHQGIELLLRNRIFSNIAFPGALYSVFSYTRSFNRFIEFTDEGITFDGKKLPGIPEQALQWQLTWKPAKAAELTTHFQYTGYQYLNDGNDLNYPGFFLLNVKATVQFHARKLGVFYLNAGMNNITGTRYASMLIVNALGIGTAEPRYYYPGLPRHAYVGIKLYI